MGLLNTPSGERIHIGFFGKRNVGKSSLINVITGQEISLVSQVAGTTTDPVYKAMELLPLGPVMIVDTAGVDDEGDLGALRIAKTKETLKKIHIAVLVLDPAEGITPFDEELISEFEAQKIKYIKVYNKADIVDKKEPGELYVSAKTGKNIDALKESIISVWGANTPERRIVGDLIDEGDFVILVTPIDESAPKGRIILPQQQTIRDILDKNAIAITVKPEQLTEVLENLKTTPRLVICDSQAFGEVSKILPVNIPLTSFSILFARYKGDLKELIEGADKIDSLKDGDTILISEGCTHHRQCEDIGTVKIPKLLKGYTKKNLLIKTTSGGNFPKDLSEFSLIIHCGGCTLTEKEMQYRVTEAKNQGKKITNYGIAIAKMTGILDRSIEIFPEL